MSARVLALVAVLVADVLRRPGAAGASVAAMAVGVAVFVSIHLTGSAARSSFVSTVDQIAGRASFEVSAPGGIPIDRLAAWATHPAVEAAQPIVEGVVAVLRPSSAGTEGTIGDGLPPLRLLGIDPFLSRPFIAGDDASPVLEGDDVVAFLTRPGTVVVSERWAEEAGVSRGDFLDVATGGRRARLEVLAIYPLEVFGEAARDLAIADIATAQETLGRTEHLDRIEIVAADADAERLRAALAPGERLERPRQRGERVGRMVDAFRLNLLALGGLALVVSALLVFNAGQFSVVRRLPLLGQLRTLGVSRRLLASAMVIETALFGAAGGACGAFLGAALARLLAQPVTRTVRDLYAFVRVEVGALTPGLFTAVVLAAVLVAALAAFLPAREAGRTAPKLVGQRSHAEDRTHARQGRLALAALVAGGLALAVPLLEERDWRSGMLAAFLLLVAAGCLLPGVMALTLPWLARAGERAGAVLLPLAAGAIHRSLARAGAAAAALAVALAMSIGVTVMVSSFEAEVRRWIAATLHADIYIADATERIDRAAARIPAAALATIRSLPGVAAIDTLRGVEVPMDGGTRSVFFCGLEMHGDESWRRIEMLDGTAHQARAAIEEGACVISEPLARRYGLGAGDRLEIAARDGPRAFPVAGVFRDFAIDRGYAFTSRAGYLSAFGDTGVRNAALFLAGGVDPEAFAAGLRARLAGPYTLSIRSNATLRREVLDVFDRTFAVTYLLQAVATGMALTGVAVTLVNLFLERGREIATLRALGASVRRVRRLFVVEAVVLAAYPVAIAAPLGAAIAWILVHVVNLRAFGWSIPYRWSWSAALLTAALTVAAGLLATVVPWRLVRRQSLARALREE